MTDKRRERLSSKKSPHRAVKREKELDFVHFRYALLPKADFLFLNRKVPRGLKTFIAV
jgi:hypothetical protein